MAAESLNSEPLWSIVRRDQLGPLKRLTDRRVAESDVVAPDGRRYRVAICRDLLPWRDTTLLSADDLTLAAISAASLLARTVAVQARVAWTITVTAPPTKWHASRTVYRERSRDAAFVVNRAIELATEIQRGRRPWTLRGTREA